MFKTNTLGNQKPEISPGSVVAELLSWRIMAIPCGPIGNCVFNRQL